MKSILCAILFTFYVAVQPICATLGDNEKKVWENNNKAVTSEVEWFSDFQIMVFKHNSGEYFAGLLDGEVVVETFVFFNGTVVDDEVLIDLLHEYSYTWYEVKSPIPECKAGVSGDNKTFFVIGRLPSVGSMRSITVFGEKWRKYDKDKIKI